MKKTGNCAKYQKRLFEIKENSEENGSTRKEMKIKIWKKQQNDQKTVFKK